MWLARFDVPQATIYYQKTSELGNILVENNGSTYSLLELSRNRDIFAGGTAETFFEIVQNVNAGEVFPVSSSIFSNLFTYRHIANAVRPTLYFQLDFLVRLYPPDEIDDRREMWFGEDIYQMD